MKLFFGAPNKYTELKSAEQVGSGRKGEEDRPDFKDVVFLTSDEKTARYYGKYVYTVQAEAVLYCDEWERRAKNNSLIRKRTKRNTERMIKTLKRNKTIYVANPCNIRILSINEHDSRK